MKYKYTKIIGIGNKYLISRIKMGTNYFFISEKTTWLTVFNY